MSLLESRPVAADVDAMLAPIPAVPQCALVAFGRPAETKELAERWLGLRADIVVREVDVAGDTVRMAVCAPRLDPLLAALRELVERVSTHEEEEPAPSHLVEAAQPESANALRDCLKQALADAGMPDNVFVGPLDDPTPATRR